MTTAEKSKQLYENQFKKRLEKEHRDRYVAIESESESYFLGDTFVEAALSAKKAFPDRKAFIIHIGHEAAFHIGASST